MNETPLIPGTDLQFHSWRKASRSTTQGSCVEVGATQSGDIAVRDSKNPGGPALVFGPVAWQQFLCGVRTADHELAQQSE